MAIGGGRSPVWGASLGLGFRLRLGREELLPSVVCGKKQNSREEGVGCRAERGWGGAGSLTLNSLLGDSSSQSLDTSHGNHRPEMFDSLWRADSQGTAGALVSPCLGLCPGTRPPTATELLPRLGPAASGSLSRAQPSSAAAVSGLRVHLPLRPQSPALRGSGVFA